MKSLDEKGRLTIDARVTLMEKREEVEKIEERKEGEEEEEEEKKSASHLSSIMKRAWEIARLRADALNFNVTAKKMMVKVKDALSWALSISWAEYKNPLTIENCMDFCKDVPCGSPHWLRGGVS